MLEDAERSGFDQIVAWQLGGCAFKVMQRDAFVRRILPKYCNQTSYKSFVRQVNLYGFSRIPKSQAKGGHTGGSYYHKAFIRGERQKALSSVKIIRESAKKGSSISLSALPSFNNKTGLSSLSKQGMKNLLPPGSSLETAIKSDAESSKDEKLPPAVAMCVTKDILTMEHYGDCTMDDESDDVSDHQDILFQHSLDGAGAWDGGSFNKSTIYGDGHNTKVASAATSNSYGINTSGEATATPPRTQYSMTTNEAIFGMNSGTFSVSPHRLHDLDTAQHLLETVDLFQHDESSGSRMNTAPVPARRRSSS
jgi:hypothetical protein